MNPISVIPHHIAFILDGNRRWAREHNVSSFKGHDVGISRVKDVIEFGQEFGVSVMTFYCFSTENWKRETDEVGYLMKLFDRHIRSFFKNLREKNVRFRHIGRKDRIPDFLLRTLAESEEKSRENSGILIQFAIDYGGRDEIVRAVKKIPVDRIQDLTEERFCQYLDTFEDSNVDLLIRTSGEERISNFLLWQIAYAEMIFVQEKFPDFTVEVFEKTLQVYGERKRRLGE